MLDRQMQYAEYLYYSGRVQCNKFQKECGVMDKQMQYAEYGCYS
jgi:hypothetical protein